MKKLLFILMFLPLIVFSQIQPQIGDLHEGGIVFYIDYDDNFMMISAPTDMIIDNYSTMWGGGIGYEWGCMSDSVIGADATDLGTGFQNTLDIINHGCFPYVNSNDFTAAHAASSYVHDNYDDWHLPSKDELEELAINNIITEGVYWSSSELPGENGGNDCWAYDCGQNQLILTDKRTTRKVRAIKTTVYEYINGCTDSLFVEYNPQANVDDGSCNITWEEQALIDIVDSLQIELITLNEDATTSLSSLQQALDTWNTTIDLSEGWNMFGYGCPSSINLVDGLSNHTETIIITKDNNGNVYMPEFGFNGIGDFTPGFGYQIKLTEAIEGFRLCDWYVNDIPLDNIVSLQEENESLLAELDSLYGCIDENACNYDETATSDNGLCEYPLIGYNCLGEELPDIILTNYNIHEAVNYWVEDSIYATEIYGHISNWDLSNVTNIESLFSNKLSFNSDISSWDVSNITNMKGLFYGANSFNGDISSWDVSNVTNMGDMFNNNLMFNCDLNLWDVSKVTNMQNMFANASSFDGDISSWDVSSVTNMDGMFSNAISFNSDLSSWDVLNVQTTKNMFSHAISFNSDLSSWDVSEVVNMTGMFYNAQSFESDLSQWDVSSVLEMSSMFYNCSSFQSDLSSWDVASVTKMREMFSDADSFNSDLSQWNVSNVTDMSYMFKNTQSFNSDLSQWNVSNVTDMTQMFVSSIINSDLSSWNVSNVTTMREMFYNAQSFESDLSSWNVSSVNDMFGMFRGAYNFNSNISSWGVSNVTDMRYMFMNCISFHSNLSSWDVSNVNRMSAMFRGAQNFNGDISLWDVSNVTHMDQMFTSASSFNSDISSWNVSNVVSMREIFSHANTFNSDISSWDVSNVIDMFRMFNNANSFNINISAWNISNVIDMTDMFYENSFSNEIICSIDNAFSVNNSWDMNIDCSIQVGDFIEGGIVFYVDETGQHGLVAAIDDLTEDSTIDGEGTPGYQWGCFAMWLSGADGQAIGTGYQNTFDIVSGCSETPIAASVALAYESENHSDWFLPSLDELKEMYNTIGPGGSEGNIGGFSSNWYWSSSESNNYGAYDVNFSDGSTGNFSSKTKIVRVRPIRSF